MTGQPEKWLRASCAPLTKPAEHARLPGSPTAFPPPPQETGTSVSHHLPPPALSEVFFSSLLVITCWGRGNNKSKYTNKGHHGEIQNQSAFKVCTSKSTLDPEAVRTCSLCSSKELVAVNLALACRDDSGPSVKGQKKQFGLSHVPFLLTLKRKIKLK